MYVSCILFIINVYLFVSFKDDRYFLSGSLDGKLRLWNIPDKKVTLWNELDGQTKLITAVNFCQNGKIAIVGSYDGRCIFYHTDVSIFILLKRKNAELLRLNLSQYSLTKFN